MKTRAVRLYGVNDLRLEEFELPELKRDEILARVVSDSICMSTYKAAISGTKHKRVPADIATNPIIVGHEFAGEIVQVGEKWKDEYAVGQKFALQPAFGNGSPYGPGYSYQYIGGDATYIILPHEVMESGCLLPFEGESFFEASLSEPMSCIIGAFHACYHTEQGKYEHKMGTVEGGRMALLAAAGPMGMGAIDYALHGPRKPSLLVVTDVDNERLQRAATLFSPEDAKKDGIELVYVNTRTVENANGYLMELTNGAGYDDVFVFAPVKEVVEQADQIMGQDGCLLFFAGPTNLAFAAQVNFYNVHYASTHILGTSGGNTDDMKECLLLSQQKLINPAIMVTHIGGLNCVADTTLNLPKIPGGKKLVYTSIDMELTAICDFEEKGKNDPLFATLSEITKRNKGLWSVEAEKFLLESRSR